MVLLRQECPRFDLSTGDRKAYDGGDGSVNGGAEVFVRALGGG